MLIQCFNGSIFMLFGLFAVVFFFSFLSSFYSNNLLVWSFADYYGIQQGARWNPTTASCRTGSSTYCQCCQSWWVVCSPEFSFNIIYIYMQAIFAFGGWRCMFQIRKHVLYKKTECHMSLGCFCCSIFVMGRMVCSLLDIHSQHVYVY